MHFLNQIISPTLLETEQANRNVLETPISGGYLIK